MTAINELRGTANFLITEANGMYRSRDVGNVAGGAAPGLGAGRLLAVSTVPTATAGTPVSGSGGTVGNGAVTSPTADAGAPAGVYQIVILNAASNAGTFEVIRPDGSVDGNGTVAVAYNGTINFTLADGSNDWVEDDRIPITVSYATGVKNYAPYTGAGTVAAILFESVVGTAERTIITRDAEVNGAHLIYQDSADDAAKAVANAHLAALGIIVR